MAGAFSLPVLKSTGHSVVGFDVADPEQTDVVASFADRAAVSRVFAMQFANDAA